MRVLHVYNLHRGGGGADNAALATIRALQSSSVEIEVFARDSSDLSPGLRGKVKAFTSGIYARNSVSAFIARLDAFRPDIVHVHELYPLISPWILPQCSRRGMKLVMSVYDYRLTCPTHNHHFRGAYCECCVGGREFNCVLQNCRNSYPESLALGLRNWVARRFDLYSGHIDRFVTPTAFTANFLAEKAQIDRDRFSILPCLIEIPKTTVDPASGKYLAFAGRFVPEKGVQVAIDAARKAGLPIRLASDIRNQPGKIVGENVECITTRNRQELAEFYRGAKMLVMPSIWFETFGIVVGEAMSHGVPVLASRIGALAETTVDGVTGLHFEPGDSGDLATKARRVWDDDDYCRRLGAAARERIVQTSSPEVHLQQLICIYESLL